MRPLGTWGLCALRGSQQHGRRAHVQRAGLPDYLPEGPNQYYEERVLHFSMLSDSTVYLYNPWSGMTYGTRATVADFNLLSALLRELDDVLGCDDRVWIPDTSFR